MVNYKTLELNQIKNKYWNMMSRCYAPSSLKSHPYYADTTVCDEWIHNRQSFFQWVKENYYEIEGEPTCHLDHNILCKGNTVYAPDKCIFVPAYINSMFGGSNNKQIINPDLPKGVKIRNGYFVASNDHASPKRRFDTPEEAWKLYAQLRYKQIVSIANKYKSQIPSELYRALLDWQIEIGD